jgi:hypothetical protein
MAGGSHIEGGATGPAGDLGHVRYHSDPPELGNHPPGVVVLVCPDGYLLDTWNVNGHFFGDIPFSFVHRLGEARLSSR